MVRKNKEKLIRVIREGGHVRRCHTIPHVIGSGYTNSSHSYNALTLLLVYHPNPSTNLVKAILWHDVAELKFGDIPGNLRIDSPDLYKVYEEEEEKYLMGIDSCFGNLTNNDKLWLMYVDKLEFLFWCRDQISLGNKTMEKYIINSISLLDEIELVDIPECIMTMLHSSIKELRVE